MAIEQVVNFNEKNMFEKKENDLFLYNKFYKSLCEDLTIHLSDWISHILKMKVKLGKLTPKHANKEVDSTPAEYVAAYLVVYNIIINLYFLKLNISLI
jgi:hypothetical protein